MEQTREMLQEESGTRTPGRRGKGGGAGRGRTGQNREPPIDRPWEEREKGRSHPFYVSELSGVSGEGWGGMGGARGQSTAGQKGGRGKARGGLKEERQVSVKNGSRKGGRDAEERGVRMAAENNRQTSARGRGEKEKREKGKDGGRRWGIHRARGKERGGEGGRVGLGKPLWEGGKERDEKRHSKRDGETHTKKKANEENEEGEKQRECLRQRLKETKAVRCPMQRHRALLGHYNP